MNRQQDNTLKMSRNEKNTRGAAKKISLICALVAAGMASAMAQSADHNTDKEAPRNAAQETKIAVELIVVEQDVVAGPYARYAQKYLGVSAPLADKVTHEIIAAKILTDSELETTIKTEERHKNHHPKSNFPRLEINKLSIAGANQSLEDNARAAADGLFRLRKSRLDLVTGDAGENVFGDGLKHALIEIDRLEKEYTMLFLGTQNQSVHRVKYEITPAQGVQTYTFCRFSEAEGALDQEDMSGAPVVLELKPIAGSTSTEGLDVAKKPTKNTIKHKLVPEAKARVIYNGNELATETMPVTQFGQIIHLNK